MKQQTLNPMGLVVLMLDCVDGINLQQSRSRSGIAWGWERRYIPSLTKEPSNGIVLLSLCSHDIMPHTSSAGWLSRCIMWSYLWETPRVIEWKGCDAYSNNASHSTLWDALVLSVDIIRSNLSRRKLCVEQIWQNSEEVEKRLMTHDYLVTWLNLSITDSIFEIWCTGGRAYLISESNIHVLGRAHKDGWLLGHQWGDSIKDERRYIFCFQSFR